MAVVSSRNTTHQSSLVGATVASRVVPTLRLDATQPVEDVVRGLTDFRPDAVVGYASMLRVLAEEQQSGRLAIRPSALISASEVLTAETRQRVRSAFGVAPTNVYAATETAGIASECQHGRMHRCEDLVIAEVVDEDNHPVPAGAFGAKLLVTVLFSRTQPLIRYELSDRVAFADGVCPDERLRVLLAAEDAAVDGDAVRNSVRAALAALGAGEVEVEVVVVDAIPRTALGKAPLIRSERAPMTASTAA
jgi:phenylacetate-coenzyme A ligase PaaK-like adenylate-forming protein